MNSYIVNHFNGIILTWLGIIAWVTLFYWSSNWRKYIKELDGDKQKYNSKLSAKQSNDN